MKLLVLLLIISYFTFIYADNIIILTINNSILKGSVYYGYYTNLINNTDITDTISYNYNSIILELPISDRYACTPFILNNVNTQLVAVVRGNCTFTEKAKNVINALININELNKKRPIGMIVLNNDESITSIGGDIDSDDTNQFLAAMFPKSVGLKLLPIYFPLDVSLKPYVRPAFDLSAVPLFFIASFTVILGAYWASAAERHHINPRQYAVIETSSSRPINADQPEEVAYLDMTGALCFVVVASIGLLILFYFITSLIYLLIGMFAFGGGVSLVACSYSMSRQYFHKYDYDIEVLYVGSINVLGSILLVPSAILAIVWAVYRNEAWSWTLQDLLSIALLITLQNSIRLPNIKVSFTLLFMAFLYDIFWVFLSGYFFKESVMVSVATGGSSGEMIPMLIRFPRINDALGGYSILGLGDIALPGLFISFLIRYDYMKNKTVNLSSYFIIGSAGYMFGLFFTFLALALMKVGQPALLYLVPCITLPVFCTAWHRGDLEGLWAGPEIPANVTIAGVSNETAFRPISQSHNDIAMEIELPSENDSIRNSRT